MSEATTKQFPARVLLTVTTGRLLTQPIGPNDNGIGALYEILGWMTGDSPFTHQLGRFSEECKPWLLRWFPELAKVDALLPALDAALEQPRAAEDREKVRVAISTWLATAQRDCGLRDTYDVPKIPADDHVVKHAWDELVEMRGTDEGVIPVVVPERKTKP